MSNEAERILTGTFVNVFSIYMRQSGPIRRLIQDMVVVFVDGESTQEERQSALETINESLFPNKPIDLFPGDN